MGTNLVFVLENEHPLFCTDFTFSVKFFGNICGALFGDSAKVSRIAFHRIELNCATILASQAGPETSSNHFHILKFRRNTDIKL